MATYYARASGNINAAIWATTPTGTAGNFFPFDPVDQLVLNGFQVSVPVTVTVNEIRADRTSTGGSIVGGTISISAGVTVNANLNLYVNNGLSFGFDAIVNGNISVPTGGGTTICWLTTKVTVNGNITSGLGGDEFVFLLNNSSAELIVNNGEILCQGGSTVAAITHTLGIIRLNNVTLRSTTTTGVAIRSASVIVATNSTILSGGLVVSNGETTLTGSIAPVANNPGITVTGGSITFNGNINPTGIYGINFSSGTASLTVNGNVSGGTTGATNSGIIISGGNPTIVINGNVTGGNGTANLNNTGITINSIANVTVNGNVTGSAGAAGIYSSVNSTLTVNGTATGGANYPGILNASIGSVTLTRAKGNGFGIGSVGLTGQVGVSNTSTGICYVRELEYGDLGMSPTSGPITMTDVTSNIVLLYRSGLGKQTLIDANTVANLLPAAVDVRKGTTFNNGLSVGTMNVPAASSTALGVAVDNTVGTAALTAAAFWDELLSNPRLAGSLGERLKDVSTVTTTGQQLADALG
jgi:hypothetical protein